MPPPPAHVLFSFISHFAGRDLLMVITVHIMDFFVLWKQQQEKYKTGIHIT